MTWQTTEPSVVDAPRHSHDPLVMQESDLSTPIIGYDIIMTTVVSM